MESYRLGQLESLAAQLRRGPTRLRCVQLLGIEFLLSVVESDKAYPYDFVCHALTGFRLPSTTPGAGRLLDGDDLIADLAVLAEDLSGDAGIEAAVWGEPVYGVADVAGRLAVSSKTIFRWHRRGLTGWRLRCADGRMRLLFPDRCVRRFVAQNTDLVTRGGNFSQLTKDDRAKIVARALELAEGGRKTVNAVARVIAAEIGRAVETIRLILKHHDEARPAAGIFNRTAPEGIVDARDVAMWEAYMDGASVETLAVRFEKPVSWVYRTITQMRARAMKAKKIELVWSADFEGPDADNEILRTAPRCAVRQEQSALARRVPSALPPYLANLFRVPLLTREGEVVLFRKMNYLKYKAQRAIDVLDPDDVRAVEVDRVEELIRAASQVKNEIVQANLRLVVSIAKRHLAPGQDLFEIISDGNVSLMRAVDKFDYTRGFKFSTYASWAVMKNFARSIPEERRRGERYQTGWDELLESAGTWGIDEAENDHVAAVRGTLERMLATLDVREQSILRRRYGLDEQGQPQTLEQIGRQLGVSKERIRQIEARAMTKLRGGFEADVARLLGA